MLSRTSDPAAGVEFHYHHPDYPFGCSFSGLVSDTQNRAWMDGREVKIKQESKISKQVFFFFLPFFCRSTLSSTGRGRWEPIPTLAVPSGSPARAPSRRRGTSRRSTSSSSTLCRSTEQLRKCRKRGNPTAGPSRHASFNTSTFGHLLRKYLGPRSTLFRHHK